MRSLIGLLGLVAGCATEPAAPFVLATAAGPYDITLELGAGSFGPTCTAIVVTFGPAPTWAAVCTQGVAPAGALVRSDSLILAVAGPAASRPLVLSAIGGTTEAPSSEWDGVWCWPNAVGCTREHGRARWSRR